LISVFYRFTSTRKVCTRLKLLPLHPSRSNYSFKGKAIVPMSVPLTQALGSIGRYAMTKDEFARRRAAFYVRDRRFNIIYLVTLFSLITVSYYFAPSIPAEHNDAITFAILAALIAVAVAPWLGGLNHAKKAGLICRACGGGLLGNPGEIAMATDSCPHCGKAPFERRARP
jgi:hypothetical protein